MKASHKAALKEFQDNSNKVCTKLEKELNQSKKSADKMASELTDLKNRHDNQIKKKSIEVANLLEKEKQLKEESKNLNVQVHDGLTKLTKSNETISNLQSRIISVTNKSMDLLTDVTAKVTTVVVFLTLKSNSLKY